MAPTARARTSDTAAADPHRKTPPARPPRRRVHTRALLLEHAERLFVEHGYQQVSIGDICEAAGFTRGAFYSNFSTKDDVMLALFDQHAGQRLSRLHKQLAAAATQAGAQEAITELLRLEPDERGFILLFLEFRLHAARNTALAAKLDVYDRAFTGALARRISAQPWARGHDADDLARTLLAAREGVLARTVRGDATATEMITSASTVAAAVLHELSGTGTAREQDNDTSPRRRARQQPEHKR
jgi:AcrR family transcriptional regulator